MTTTRPGAPATAWRRFSRHRLAVAGAILLVALAAVSVAAPWLAPYEPDAQNWRERLQAPSLRHPFGTDHVGRDVLSRVLFGGRLSLASGLLPVLLGGAAGTLLGLVAGFSKPWMDSLIMRIMDVLLALPSLFLALAVVGTLGPGWFNAVLAVAVVSVPGYARIVRARVLALKNEPFVEAARASGAKSSRILMRHVLPNALSPILVQATLSFGSALLSMAGLSFLGLGVQPPAADWGNMLAASRRFLPRAYWLGLFPGMCIMLAVLAINLIGDGLRDALDPRSEDRRA
ncbi:MAG: ABC transporter permease [Firmicutes bacterium]|nr:ABC transporter permease [Bacillota bacterium]